MNGYADSIMQPDTEHCLLCGRAASDYNKLDRHEPFGGAYRQKSKRLGLWCTLCHESCHEYGTLSAHVCRETNLALKRKAERAALDTFGWSTDDFIREFGKNVLE